VIDLRSAAIGLEEQAQGLRAEMLASGKLPSNMAVPYFSWGELSERLTALEAVTTARIATGQIAVLNNPAWVYEKGRRELAVDARTTTVEALSGKVVEADGERRIVIDSAIDIRSERPLHARYVGASRPERSRASDVLSLNWLDGPRSWRKGQTISEYRVRVTCGE